MKAPAANRAALFPGGVFLAGASAALLVPGLPLRLGLPALLLLAGALFPARRTEANLRVLLLASIWVWAGGCLLAAEPGGPRTAAMALLALGLALGLPTAAAGLRALPFLGLRLDAGYLLGTLILGGMGTALALLWPQRIEVRITALLTLLGISWLGYLPARTAAADLGRARRAAVAGLLLSTAALLATVGLWQLSRLRAARHEPGADPARALAASRQEVGRVRSLGLPGSLADALRRRARLAERVGDRAGLREFLREAAELDPGDQATRGLLLRLALDDPYGSLEIRDNFAALPDSLVDPDTAARILPRAMQAGDWAAFGRAWRLAGEGRPREGFQAGDLAAAGEALYFAGDHATAADLLRSSLGAPPEWRRVRLLFFSLLRGGLAQEARAVLDAADPSGHEEEAAVLATLAAGPAPPGEGGVSFEGALKLLELRIEDSPAAPGGEFRLRFTWEVLAPVPPAWRVFVHLRREVYGGFLFQGDHEFGGVGHPTADLACGSRFGYAVAVRVPREAPAGKYSVTAGLWDGSQNRHPSPVPPLPAGLKLEPGMRVRLLPGARVLHAR